MMDYYSKWPEVKFVREITSKSVVEFLKYIFLKEGFPEYLVTDKGPQFVATEVEDFLVTSGIKHLKSSLFHPQTNGLVERMNRVLGECIQWALANKCLVADSVRSMLWFYRTTPHSTTGVSPFELLRRRIASTTFSSSWMNKWVKSGRWSDACVRRCMCLTQEKQKLYFDSKKNVKEFELIFGDFVRVKKPVHVKKGGPKFGSPIKVVEVRRDSVKLVNDQWWNKCFLVKSGVVGAPSGGCNLSGHGSSSCDGPTVLRRSSGTRNIPARYRI